jgi:hypothetical protein
MALVVDAAGKQTANPKTGKINNGGRKTKAVVPKVTTSSIANELPPVRQQPASTVRAQTTPSIQTSSMAKPISVKPKPVTPASIEEPSDERTDEEITSAYEKYFGDKGMDKKDIDEINSRGSWLDIHLNNPATAAVTDNLGQNPFSSMSLEDLRGDIDRTARSIKETGDLPAVEVPEKYKAKDNTDTIGDIRAVDDGNTFDYDHLTAGWATGPAMQDYLEAGFGGRNSWWDYDPNAIYNKADEADDYDFKAYTPDQTARDNLRMLDKLDAPSDTAGFIGRARTLALPYLTNLLGVSDDLSDVPSYKIRYDQDKNPETTNDVMTLNGLDYDYHATPYYNNMLKLFEQNPELFMSAPENGEIHGAPVSTLVRQNLFNDVNGNPTYAYGNIVDAQGVLHIPFTDGTSVDVPASEYQNWSTGESGNIVIPDQLIAGHGDIDYDNVKSDVLRLTFSDGRNADVLQSDWLDEDNNWLLNDDGDYAGMTSYGMVSPDAAAEQLPENIDSWNEGIDNWQYAPVLYLPDMVMDDGTRLTWNQFNEIYNDKPDDGYDGIWYDYNLMNKPTRLMKNNGQIFNDDMTINFEDIIPSSIDMTLGSLPISFDYTAWPLSVSQALSKSLSGIDPGSYDALTGSDRYISAEPDENGNLVPNTSGLNKAINATGTALTPLTEQIAGPISGHSLIESLSGETPVNPTLAQLGKAYLIGALGEGIEEIPGNFFDELISQGTSLYGNPVTNDGKRLLDRDPSSWLSTTPAVDENGNYLAVGADGEPLDYVTDQVGHIYKDPNTPLSDRVLNFLSPSDLANALAGGFLVDTAMQLLPGGDAWRIPGAYRNTNYRRQQGLSQFVRPDEDSEYVEADPRFIRMFDDRSAYDKALENERK